MVDTSTPGEIFTTTETVFRRTYYGTLQFDTSIFPIVTDHIANKILWETIYFCNQNSFSTRYI